MVAGGTCKYFVRGLAVVMTSDVSPVLPLSSPLLSFSLITSRHGGVDFVAASMGERKTHLETIEAK